MKSRDFSIFQYLVFMIYL